MCVCGCVCVCVFWVSGAAAVGHGISGSLMMGMKKCLIRQKSFVGTLTSP